MCFIPKYYFKPATVIKQTIKIPVHTIYNGRSNVLSCAAKIIKTRTVRKSDYTPALALPKHMAGIFDKKCREKEKYRKEQIGECPFSIPLHNLSL